MLKKLFNTLLILFVGFYFLTGCVTPSDDSQKLKTPEIELSADEISIIWDKIQGATHYEIYINHNYVCDTNKNSYTLDLLYEDYEIKIKACDNTNKYLKSDYSNTLTIEYEPSQGETPIITPKKLDVNFFMINDTHGAFIDEGTPGMERVAGLLDSLEENGDNYIKIANGDIFQGSYVSNIKYGLAMVDALNALDFDVFVLGNHEFDWGLDKIKVYRDGDYTNGELECPILGANVVYKNTTTIVDFLDPYHIVEVDGLKVGIIGAMGYGLESSILTENVADYQFLDPSEIIEDYSTLLRTEKDCDIVVAAIHGYDEYTNYELANLSGNARIDAIFCGHTHQRILESVERVDGKTIPVIQNYSQNVTAGIVQISLNEDGSYKTYSAYHKYPQDYNKSTKLETVIQKYQNDINEGNRVLGVAETYLSKQTIGQLATNAMKAEFNVDISILNTGGVRDTLEYGNITVGNVYNVFPFNNVVYTVELKGSKIISLYNNNYNYLYFNSDFDVNSIDSSKIYSIAVIDYVFTSPYYSEFKNVEFVNTNILMRDIFIEFIENHF